MVDFMEHPSKKMDDDMGNCNSVSGHLQTEEKARGFLRGLNTKHGCYRGD